VREIHLPEGSKDKNIRHFGECLIAIATTGDETDAAADGCPRHGTCMLLVPELVAGGVFRRTVTKIGKMLT
jgi:hypothetical protein